MTMTERERFSIGDHVWVAGAGQSPLQRPCRVCAGDKTVTLILGSGEQVSLDCGMCAAGHHAPTGVETYYEYGAVAVLYRVTGIEAVVDEEGERVRYRSGSDGAYSILDHEQCYATREEALASCAPLIAEHEAEQERRMAFKEKNTNKSYAWNAGYHLREAKRCRTEAERHERKAVLLKAKAKTEAPNAD